MTKNLQTT